jgi:hypothetical protein
MLLGEILAVPWVAVVRLAVRAVVTLWKWGGWLVAFARSYSHVFSTAGPFSWDETTTHVRIRPTSDLLPPTHGGTCRACLSFFVVEALGRGNTTYIDLLRGLPQGDLLTATSFQFARQRPRSFAARFKRGSPRHACAPVRPLDLSFILPPGGTGWPRRKAYGWRMSTGESSARNHLERIEDATDDGRRPPPD